MSYCSGGVARVGVKGDRRGSKISDLRGPRTVEQDIRLMDERQRE